MAMRNAFISLTNRVPLSSPRSLSSSRPLLCPSRPRMCSTTPDTAMQSVEQKLRDTFSPTRLQVTPTYGDPNGSHVSITIVASAFEDTPLVRRHQKVYQVIWEELSGPIHAVDELITKTPSEDEQ